MSFGHDYRTPVIMGILEDILWDLVPEL